MENCSRQGECNLPHSICNKICAAYIKLSKEAAVIREKIGEKDLIDKAKWRLAEQKKMSEKEALGIMIRESRKERRKLAETASLILSGKGLQGEQYSNARVFQRGFRAQASR